ELALGRDRPTLTGFGQVALPVGAVQQGEIVDSGVVSASLRRLWSEAGFRTRRVIVGVGNQRVIVRHVELPRMSEPDLRSAIRFEAESLIPIPVDEAVLDFQILDEGSQTTGNAMPVLLVAAQREMVRTLLAAVEGAGLSVTLVDVAAFALMRALPDNTLGLDELGPARGIVSIGAGVTNVVVHERGVPRFVRTLTIGGDDVTTAIAEELDIDVDMAEDLKRRADVASSDELVAQGGRS